MEAWAWAGWKIHMLVVLETVDVQQFTEEQLETFMDRFHVVLVDLWLDNHPPSSSLRTVFRQCSGEIWYREADMLPKHRWLE